MKRNWLFLLGIFKILFLVYFSFGVKSDEIDVIVIWLLYLN